MRDIKKKDIYYAHVFAVQLGEPGVVGNGCHNHCQVPGKKTTDKIQNFKLANSICSKPFDPIDL